MTNSDGNCDLLGSREVISCIRLSFLGIFCVSLLFPAELLVITFANSRCQPLTHVLIPCRTTFYFPCLLLLSAFYFEGCCVELAWLGNSRG